MNRILSFVVLASFFAGFFVFQQAWGANCSSSNISVFTQLEVENFQATYGDGGICDRVSGDLYIGGGDITSINGLIDLMSIGGDLTIRSNAALTDIDGLANLTSVGRALTVRENTALTNIRGLKNLTSVAVWVNVSENAVLTNIDELASLSNAWGVHIVNNPVLTNIDGLSGMTSITFSLTITGNNALMNVDGLVNLTSVGNSFHISDNPVMENIDGLAGLTNVGLNLYVDNNNSLTNIDGLAGLTDVERILSISGNPLLTDIDGLSSLINVRALRIFNNANLTDINGLTNLSDVGEETDIHDNPSLTNIDGLVGFTSLKGDLAIHDNESLTNINGLINLSSSSGVLEIKNNPVLTDIDGLASLSNAGEGLYIRNNPLLSEVDGLTSLVSVSGTLALLDNPTLANIDGLANLTSIGSGLGITDNPLLADIDGLASLTTFRGGLNISRNTSLTNVDALENISSVSLDLGISDNPALTSIAGIENVTTIGRSLIISGNTALKRIGDLPSLVSIGWDLEIYENDALSGINGLNNLGSVSGVSIYDNAVLTTIDGLSSLSNVAASIEIYGNPSLVTISGLHNVPSAYSIAIINNPVLTHINGFTSLATLRGALIIRDNDSLTRIDGLINLARIDRDLEVRNNGMLAHCSVLGPLLGWPDGSIHDNIGSRIAIYENTVGCDSPAEVLASVSLPTAPGITDTEVGDGETTLIFSPATTTDAFWEITNYQARCAAIENIAFQNTSATDIPTGRSIVSNLELFGVPFNGADGLSVTVDITHPLPHDLRLTLTSPGGASVTLWDQAVSDSEDITGTFPTSLTPVESFDVFDGSDFNGDWQLTVASGHLPPTGTLNSWGIEVRDTTYVTAYSTNSPITVTGLSNHRIYECTVSAESGLGPGPASNTVSIMPMDAQGADFQINPGLNDAWYYPVTNGQGFFITVFPDLGSVVASWFTYDTVRPLESVTANLGEPGHRWFNAIGTYSGNRAVMKINIASGGLFDTQTDIDRVEDGTMILTFTGCNNGTVEYDIPSIGQSGFIPIQRVAHDNVALCDTMSEGAKNQETNSTMNVVNDHALSHGIPVNEVVSPLLEMNPGLNDAWYYPVTDGQGFFITVFPEMGSVVASWFTYDTVRPAEGVTANLGEPGHRWFNASGAYSGNQAIMNIEIASGGLFDTSTTIDRVQDGTMILTFDDCNSGTVEYDIPSIGQSGIVPIQRTAGDNIALCEALSSD